MPKIILASQSPFRKKMLEELNIPFEVIVSNADETADESFSFGDQLEMIALRKAQTVFEKTINKGRRIIVAADQNIVFHKKMYGKPHSIDEARKIIFKMRGSNKIYSFVGNAIIVADGDKIIQEINNYDTAKMCMDYVRDEVIEDYLKNTSLFSKCAGIHIDDVPFLHLIQGRQSTARGMTTEYLQEILES